MARRVKTEREKGKNGENEGERKKRSGDKINSTRQSLQNKYDLKAKNKNASTPSRNELIGRKTQFARYCVTRRDEPTVASTLIGGNG